MKKFAICYFLFALCVTGAVADDATIDLNAQIAAALAAAATETNQPATAPTAAAQPAAPTIARAGIMTRVIAPTPAAHDQNPAPTPPTDTTPPVIDNSVASGAPVARAAVPSRVAITSVTNARAATGDVDAQQTVAQQAVTSVASRVAVPRATGDNSAAPRVITSAPTVSRAAAGQTVQNNNQTAERAEFHPNEKGIANESSAVRRAGVSLRPSVAEVGGRAAMPGTAMMPGSNAGDAVSGRAAVVARASSTFATNVGGGSVPVANRPSTTTMTTDAANINSGVSVQAVTDKLSSINDLSASCVQNYADCMDQFCNVLDKNQARCSCSDRISTYTKTEQAVKDANTQLNQVAQNIRYVGLSADEIRAIMNATEAEQAMQGQTDTTANRALLNSIANMITIPSTSGSDTPANNTIDLTAMNIDFSDTSNASDMFSLDSLLGGNSTFSNLRGASLYSAAKNKCANVLNTCVKAGASSSLVTGQYDMMIDKDCNTYVATLTKMNDTLKTNVRSATLMLQQARLQVLQNNNAYDEKACVGALATCMTDDMVCGANYEKCLDPTKRYIDADGKVILGQDVTNITKMMADFDNTNFTVATNVSGLSQNVSCNISNLKTNGDCIAWYLINRMGTGEDATSGLCRPVMNKCRRYTWNGANGAWNPTNDVILNYLQNAMVQIKANQVTTISNYAQTCLQDVATCYNGQVSQINQYTSAASASSVINVMRGACRNVALTCAYAIFASPGAKDMDGNTYLNKCRPCATGTVAAGNCVPTTDPEACIEDLSNIFYQTMLCPANSTYAVMAANQTGMGPGVFVKKDSTGTKWTVNATTGATNVMVNDKCVCLPGYGYSAGQCLQKPDNSNWSVDCTLSAVGNVNSSNAKGGCAIVGYSCFENYTPSNGVCVAPVVTGGTT